VTQEIESVRRKQRWERFFTVAGLDWKPTKHNGFDYTVELPCSHSECSGSHVLGVQISISEAVGEEFDREYESFYPEAYLWEEPYPALFGAGPRNTRWQMGHGEAGGFFDLWGWVMNADKLWEYTQEALYRGAVTEKETIN
jgi:hypothetical protein